MTNITKLSNQTMTSIQLAEMLGYEKKEVNKKIRIMFGADTARKIFSHVESIGLNAGKIDYYDLPEKESKMFVAKHDIAYLEEIVQFWIDKNNLRPLSLEEMTLQVIEGQREKIENQKKEIKFKNVLIVASNEASIKAGDIKVSEFCKSTDIVDIGRNLMFDWMRDQGFLFKDSCEPKQHYVNRGFFKWLPSEVKFGGEIRYTLFITARGKVWLASKYMSCLDSEQIISGLCE